MVKIRKAHSDDLDRVAEITKDSFPDIWTKLYFEKLYRQYSETFFVAEINREVVGYVLGYLKSEKLGWVKAVAVSPDFRGQGIGNEMINFITHRLGEMGAENIGLRIRISNQASISFYRKLGFKIAGTDKSYFPNGEDAYILEKKLGG